MTASLAAVIVTATAATAVAGPCNTSGWRPQVLTPVDAEVPSWGAILVGVTPGGDAQSGGAFAANPAVGSFELVRGTDRSASFAQMLAPGLARYRVDSGARGEWTFVGESLEHSFSIVGAGAATKLPPPRLRAVALQSMDMGRPNGSKSTWVEAYTQEAKPDSVIGMILYDAEEVGDGGVDHGALLFQRFPGSKTTAVLYTAPGRCQARMPGLREPVVGDKVQAAWVDVFGRVSARSSAVEVGAPLLEQLPPLPKLAVVDPSPTAPKPSATEPRQPASTTPDTNAPGSKNENKRGCGCRATGTDSSRSGWLLVVALAVLAVRHERAGKGRTL